MKFSVQILVDVTEDDTISSVMEKVKTEAVVQGSELFKFVTGMACVAAKKHKLKKVETHAKGKKQ